MRSKPSATDLEVSLQNSETAQAAQFAARVQALSAKCDGCAPPPPPPPSRAHPRHLRARGAVMSRDIRWPPAAASARRQWAP